MEHRSTKLNGGAATFAPVILHSFPDPPLEALWREMLQRLPLPSHYTSPEFFREPYFEGRSPFAVLAAAGDGAHSVVHGVMTGFHDGAAVSCGLETRPQLQIEPGASGQTVDALRRGLEEEAGNAELVTLYSWSTGPLDALLADGFRRTTMGSIPVLDLSVGIDKVQQQFERKRRTAIRLATKSGVEAGLATGPDDYREFCEMYRSWCDAKKIACSSLEMEQQALIETGDSRRLFVARYQGRIIAGSVFRFYPGGLFEYSRNCSLPEFQQYRPNDLLLLRGMEWACSQGYRTMSMGASHRFLRAFGGEMTPVYRYRSDRTWLRKHDRKEQLLQWGAATVSRLPERWETAVRKILRKEKQPGW